MEWKKVRNWLILLVLAVDLILAGNLAMQVLGSEQTLRQAAEDAIAVASSRGVDISLEAVLRLPKELTVYEARRSDSLEQDAANALLGGQAEKEASGGGVSIYRAESGQMGFRRGGSVELDGPWSWESFDARECIEALDYAGFPMDGVSFDMQNGAVELVQSYDGYPVFNSRLMCLCGDGRLQVRGRWMLAAEAAGNGVSLSRAQMILALCDALEDGTHGRLLGVQAGYYLQSEDAQSLTLEPVWAAETEEGQLILSCVTGEQLNF